MSSIFYISLLIVLFPLLFLFLLVTLCVYLQKEYILPFSPSVSGRFELQRSVSGSSALPERTAEADLAATTVEGDTGAESGHRHMSAKQRRCVGVL